MIDAEDSVHAISSDGLFSTGKIQVDSSSPSLLSSSATRSSNYVTPNQSTPYSWSNSIFHEGSYTSSKPDSGKLSNASEKLLDDRSSEMISNPSTLTATSETRKDDWVSELLDEGLINVPE